MDPELAAICASHGTFLRREAIGLGYDDRAIARLVRDGVWHRVRHGAYTYADLWRRASPAGRHRLTARAAMRTANCDAVLSHVSSVLLHTDEFWSLPLDTVHLTRLDGRAGRAMAGIHQHRGRLLPHEVEYDGALPYTSATRAALELATLVDLERSLVVTNALLHAGKTTRPRLEAAAVDMLTWPSTLRHELLLRHCDGRLESVGETRAWCAIWRAGLPPPVPQFVVVDEHGCVVARLDFAWPDRGVWLEFDGRTKYDRRLPDGETAADVVMREKRREQVVAELTGWVCVRADWSDLSHPERLVGRLTSAFALARRRTG